MKIAILGAGFTGLELGRRLKESGKDFIIIEKEPKVGGLCQTNKTGDYYWDFAVHAIYSRHQNVMDYFHSLPLNYEFLNRNVKIFHTGRDGNNYIIDYPFENGIKDLPLEDKLDCIRGYLSVKRKHHREYSDLNDWIVNRLGSGIAKHFMLPYNTKIWDCRLSEISTKLVDSKIEPASVVDFILSALGKKIVGRAYQARFIYPKQGIQSLMDHTAKNIRENIVLDSCVEKLSRFDDQWTIILSNGLTIKADYVISTIPLPELLKRINVEGIKQEYVVFKHNNTFFIMVGLKKGFDFQKIRDCHWVFFKESEIFYRLTLMHNFSSEFLPVLVAEITRKGECLAKSKEEICNLVVRDLLRSGIVGSPDEIAVTDIKLKEYTYPIPTVGLDYIKDEISDKLLKHNLFLLGRNGHWDYINMDDVVLKVEKFIEEMKGTTW